METLLGVVFQALARTYGNNVDERWTGFLAVDIETINVFNDDNDDEDQFLLL